MESSSSNHWEQFTETSTSGIYSATYNTDYNTKIIIVRLKPSTEDDYSSANNGLNWDNKWDQSNDITSVPTNDIYYTNADGDWSNWNPSSTYNITADLYGGFSGFAKSNTLTRSSACTYTGTLDLSATNNDQYFKLVVNGDNWLGYNNANLTVTDNDLIADETDDDSNLKLLNSSSGYKTYDVTASWALGSGWTLTITGKAARTNDAYSVSFVKVRDWNVVKAHVFSELGGNTYNSDVVATWPGTDIAKSGSYDAANGLTYDVYTYSFNSTFVPQKVIFNDGTNQTATFDFTNNHQYTDEVPDKVYAAVGANYKGDEPGNSSALFFNGKWNQESTTDFMTLGADGHTYFINFKNKELSNGTTIYTKTIDKATTNTASAANWYPTSEKQWTITADGTYDVLITFDTTYGSGLWNDGSVTITATATPSTINVSAGSKGKATFSSAYPLDFTGVSAISAYTVSALSSTSATLSKVTGVAPAETGLLIIGEANANVDVPTTTSAGSVGTNYLKAALKTTTVNNDYAYVLSSGKFHPANAGTIPANKAYLLKSDIDAAGEPAAPSLSLVFSETTGISDATRHNINEVITNNSFFNLNGQRVAQPTKGLYIVNGKKVIIK